MGINFNTSSRMDALCEDEILVRKEKFQGQQQHTEEFRRHQEQEAAECHQREAEEANRKSIKEELRRRASEKKISPSAGRRKALKEADSVNNLQVLGSCPLFKYLDIADLLLELFQDAVVKCRLDEAYVFGLRFVSLALSSLPQHPQWKLNTNSGSKKRLASQVNEVILNLDVIKQQMDAEELMKIEVETIAREEERIRKKEAEEHQRRQLDEERWSLQRKRNNLEEERAQFHALLRSKREIEQKSAIGFRRSVFSCFS